TSQESTSSSTRIKAHSRSIQNTMRTSICTGRMTTRRRTIMAKYYVRMVAKIEAGSAEEAVQVAEHISDAVTYHDGFDAAGLVSLALDDRSDERLVSEDDDTLAELLRDFTTARD